MRTSCFWSSRNWNNSGIAADFSCWTSAASGSIGGAGRVRIALAAGVNLPGHGAQRGFHRRPVIFLVGRKPQALLDAGDLHVAEQRVGFLRRRLGGELRLRRRSCAAASSAGRRASASRCRRARRTHRPAAAARSGLRSAADRTTPAPAAATASLSCLLSRFATGLLSTSGDAISARAAGTLSRPRMLVAAAPTTSETGQRDDGDGSASSRSPFGSSTTITLPRTGH